MQPDLTLEPEKGQTNPESAEGQGRRSEQKRGGGKKTKKIRSTRRRAGLLEKINRIMWGLCAQCGRPGFHPWVGKIPREGNGNPLRYSCLENSMDGGARWVTVYGVTQSDTT